jgi:hypothetical protein
VTFTPTAGGSRTGTVVVGSSVPGTTTPIVTVPVGGNGGNSRLPLISANPTGLTFGTNLPLAPGKTKALTITNSGGSTLQVTGATVQDGIHPGAHVDYTVNATDCLGGLLPGASCVIDVTFVGHAVGQRGANLSITSNATGSPLLIGLQATVGKPTVLANPDVNPPGRVTVIDGTGFAPNHQVDVTFVEFPQPVTVTADAHGDFALSLLVFPHGFQGPATVNAQTHGASTTISAQTPLLIVLGSVDSSNTAQTVTRH